MTKFNEARCLAVDPFDGDFGSPGDRIFRNVIVTSRKALTCSCCNQLSVPGTRVRVIVALFDGDLHRYRYCAECCSAMAKSWTDRGKAWEARIAIREA
ncbi:MAG: hypothetical protein WC869_01275 [Phycisphaerae bacterium]|jgi:hypothetical protein